MGTVTIKKKKKKKAQIQRFTPNDISFLMSPTSAENISQGKTIKMAKREQKWRTETATFPKEI